MRISNHPMKTASQFVSLLLAGFLPLASTPLSAAMQGDVTVTGQVVRKVQDSNKFEEYRTVPSGVFVEELSLSADHEKTDCSLELKGRKLGLEDQSVSVEAKKLGLMKLGVKYDQTPHVFSLTGKTLFVHDGSGRMSIPDQTQIDLQASTHAAQRIFTNVPPTELKLRRDSFKADVEFSPAENLSLRIRGGNEDRNGTRPIGVTWGYSSLAEVPEPISYHTREAGISAQVNTGDFSSALSYDASFFRNDINALTVEYPWRITGSAVSGSGGSTPNTASLALPPDNQSHNISLALGKNLPFWSGRLNSQVSYGWMLQNDPFLPPTSSTEILTRSQQLGVNLNSPQDSLDGKMYIWTANSSLSLRPIQPLAISGKVRYYKLENKTQELTFDPYVPYDSSFSTATPIANFNASRVRKSLAIGYSKLSAGTDLSYQLLSMLGLNLGYNWERMDRKNRDVAEINEHTVTAALNILPSKWITLRPNYLHAHRYSQHYDVEIPAEETYPLGEGTNALGTSESLRRFDEANRLRDVVGIKGMIYPLESITVGAEYAYRLDHYIDSLYGTQAELNHSAAMDVTYDLREDLSLYGNYSREENTIEMKSRYRQSGNASTLPYDNESADWFGISKDVTNTFGVGASGNVIKKKLDADASYNFSQSEGQLRAMNLFLLVTDSTKGGKNVATQTTGSTARDFPKTRTELHRVSGALNWHVLENLTARLKYEYERYMVDDFAFEYIQPWQAAWNMSTFLDATQGDYEVHSAALSLIYKF